ncbi:hypothetical protein RDI58_017976 [Solanum bulbocastanum]|uniref:Uncharacterized protein n=1 Tax=Solanum bulbocastanum TaxID=147425 RepID=A0AAN8TIP4_SOLBU
MKLGEQSRQARSSDEDDVIVISSDSDYIGSSDEDEAQASGVADIDLTTEAVWPNITQGRKSYRSKG